MFVEALTTLPGIPSHDESIRSLVIQNILKAIVQAIHINCCYLYQYLFRQIYDGKWKYYSKCVKVSVHDLEKNTTLSL